MSDTGNITVFGRGPNYNRFKVAHDIQDACNPSGVAHELVRVIQDAMRDPLCTGTTWVCADPAVVAVIDKLQSLTRLDAFKAHRICGEKADRAPKSEALVPARAGVLADLTDGRGRH